MRKRSVDEGINGMLLPLLGGVLGLRHCGAFGFLVGPVGFILRPLLDPFSDNLSLLRGEGITMLGGRHDHFRVLADDAHEGLAGLRVSRDDGLDAILVLGSSALKGVEAQIGTAFLSIRAVAEEAGVGEQGADVLVKADLVLTGQQGGSE